jgi:oligosaccharyltransferase complex subunit delta (ribophorin II)
MRVTGTALSLLAFAFTSTLAASAWTFDEATLNIQGKGAGVGGGVKEKYDTTQWI